LNELWPEPRANASEPSRANVSARSVAMETEPAHRIRRARRAAQFFVTCGKADIKSNVLPGQAARLQRGAPESAAVHALPLVPVSLSA
jgi:hypothetical protein